MPVKTNIAPTFRMYLDKVVVQRHEARLKLYDENGEPMGILTLYYRKIIDHSKKQGSCGYIKYPSISHFPDKIILKKPKPVGR